MAAAETEPNENRPDATVDLKAAALEATADVKSTVDPRATVVLNQTLSLFAEHGEAQPGGGPPPVRSRYQPLRPHARGGLGEVFVARDEELGREVALKAIQDRLADDPSNRARFVREAEITGNLEHPGIVPVYGLGRSADGRPYYAMRFIEGESLAAAIDRFHATADTAPSAGERSVALLGLLRRFNDVCRAIEYAHSRGIIHRDLKPSNIMLGRHGETLVVDWGLAKFVAGDDVEAPIGDHLTALLSGSASDQTLPGSAIGTPAFMSPEQAAGRLDELGPASDIYNLGATLYCLLTGQAPFLNAPAGVLLARVQNGEFPPPSSIATGPIPRALEAICQKAMALRPEARYKSARAIAEDVERWIADEPVSAQPETALARLARWSRRHRAWVRAGIAGVAGLAIVMSVATGFVHQAWQREQSVRIASQHLAAGLDLDRGVSLCEQGTTGLGMLRMAHALAITPADAKDLRRTILVNLDAWRAPTIPLREMFVHPDSIWSVALSPDGRTVLTGGTVMDAGKLRGEARLWDAADGKLRVAPLPHASYVNSVGFSPDGRRVITGCGDRTVRFWDADDGRPLGQPLLLDDPVETVAIAPDGRTFLTVAGRSLQVWDAADRRPLQPAPPVQPALIHPAVYSPDGSLIATGDEDGVARLWSLNAGASHGAVMEHGSAVNCLAFSPDGATLATGDEDGNVQFWDVATQQRRSSRQAHRSEIYSLAFSPDGRVLATAGDDGTARYWDAATGRTLGLPMEHLGAVTAVAFTPDGRALATGSGDAVARLWAGPTRQPLLAKSDEGERIIALSESPDGKTVAVVDAARTIRLLDAAALTPLRPARSHGSALRALDYNPNGTTIATGDAAGVVQLWSAADLQPVGRPLTFPGAIIAVSFSPDGRAVLAAGEDAVAKLWDPVAGRLIGPPLPLESEIYALGFSPDGRAIATAEGRTIRLWDVDHGVPTGKVRQTLHGHQGLIYSLRFSRDGRLLATGSEDGTARVWDVATGRPLGPPLSHKGSVIALDFAPDGLSLLTGCNDQTARLWALPTGRPVGPPIKHLGRVAAVAFHHSGDSFLTGSYDRAVRRWDAPRPWADQVDRIKSRIQGLTGMTLGAEADPSARGNVLDDRAWRLERAIQDAEEQASP